MARSIALSTLVTRCLRRANKEAGGSSDASVEPYETKALISSHFGEMHAVVSETGSRYFETDATITATGAASYALPSDHFSTIGISRLINSAGQLSRLRKLGAQRRVFFAGLTGDARYYALEGSNIVLYPKPSSGTYKHLYIPQPTDYSLSADSTTLDVINVYGEEFIVWGVASVLLHKGEADQIRALKERDRMRDELKAWAVARVISEGEQQFVDDDDFPLSEADWRVTPP
jgi:hypothetical protein